MPWLFLVAVIRPLSMSFSFDASGKVYLAAYLASFLFYFLILSPSVSLLVVAAHLFSQPAHTAHILYQHTAHTFHVMLQWLVTVGCGLWRWHVVMWDSGQSEDTDESKLMSDTQDYFITVQTQRCSEGIDTPEVMSFIFFSREFGVIATRMVSILYGLSGVWVEVL